MSEIPKNEVTQEGLNEWYRLSSELTRIKNAEMLLRTKIFKNFFPHPVEGTNTVPLAAGWVIKGKHTIRRDIDKGSLEAYRQVDAETQKSKLEAAGINVDTLLKWEPELVLREYRKLTPEQLTVFDNILVIKDGSPALEITLPAKAQKEKLDEIPS